MRSITAALAAFTVTVCATVSALPSNPAVAAHFSGATGGTGCNGGLNRAINADHTYYYDGLTSTDSNAMDWTRSNNMNPTNMNTSKVSQLAGGTDVRVEDDNYTNFCGAVWLSTDSPNSGAVGLVTCATLESNGDKCKQHVLRMNTYFTNNTTTANTRGLACHENGHTVGLMHRSQFDVDGELVFTCMHQQYPKNANAYDSHDVAVINNHY